MSIESVLPIDVETLPAGQQTWRGHLALTQTIAGWQWVRLAHVGTPSYLVLMRISPNADEHDAVCALEWWLRSPGREDGDVIEVNWGMTA